MTMQVIKKDGHPEYAVVPWDEFQALRQQAEMLEDLQVATIISRSVENGEETYPDELLGRLLDDENPVKVWREYRGLTEKALAEEIGLAPEVISRIETGEQEMSVSVLKRLSKTLRVDMDDLVG